MISPAPEPHALEIHKETYSKTMFGFWVYLMTDCLLFATLFATHAVLQHNTAGGPSSKELFDLPFALGETLVLLTSTFTSGQAMLAADRHKKNQVLGWFGVTFLLGVVFLAMEMTEFVQFVQGGNSWERSAFLSSFFTLVGTHGLHITVGLIWMSVMMFQILTRGITFNTYRRVASLSLFWHFLDVIWIFIFTFVYLMGVI